MRVYILSADKNKYADIAKALLSSNIDVVWISSIDEIKLSNKSASFLSVILISGNEYDPSSALSISTLASKKLHIFIVLDKISPSDYKLYSRIDGLDITDTASAPVDIIQYFKKSNETSSNAVATHNEFLKQLVVTFVGAGGGSGNTTLAMETGIALSTQYRNKGNGRVAFLDLDLSGGPVCDYLNIEARLDINEISVNPNRLDSYMLEIMSAKHISGMDVFSSKSIYQSTKANQSNIALLSLLNCVVDNYNVTIIDMPNRSPIDCSEILRNSDIIFITGIFSVPSAKRIKKEMQSLLNLGIEKSRIRILITDTDTNILGKISQRFNIDSVFKGYNISYIRRDRSFALECVDSGVSMLLTEPKRGICKDIFEISKEIMK